MPYVRLILSILALVFAGLLPSAAEAGARVALVIGNSNYQNVPRLVNPVRDAGAIAERLKAIGFETDVQYDLSREGFAGALAEFSAKADGAELAIVYFAGHGIEVDRANYLIPADAKLESDRRARFELISLDDVLASLSGVKGVRAVFLDACRTNPFLTTMSRSAATRSIGQGLAEIEAPDGTVISYAARENTVAADGLGEHSPYATALLKVIDEPGLEIQFMLRKMRDEVKRLTNERQDPYISASIPGDPIFLVPPPEKPELVRGTSPDTIQSDFDATKAIGTPQAWQAFLDAHGHDSGNLLVKLAIEARRKALEEAKPAAPVAEGGTGSRVFAAPEETPPAAVNVEPAPPEPPAPVTAVEAPKENVAPKPATKAKPNSADKKPEGKPPTTKPKTTTSKAKPKKPAEPKSARKASAPKGPRPDARRYSYNIWSEGSLRTGKRVNRGTEHGTLSCVAMRAFGSDEEINRICRWE